MFPSPRLTDVNGPGLPLTIEQIGEDDVKVLVVCQAVDQLGS